MYISFYITDVKNTLIFQYLPGVNAPTWSNLWIRIKYIYPDSLDGVDNKITVGKHLAVFKYYSEVNNINYWCLKTEETEANDNGEFKRDSLVDPYIFLERMDEILMEYFDKEQLTIKKLTNNYDRLTMVFNYCTDGGEPNVSGAMYTNKIKNVLPLQNNLTKFINSTAKNISDVVSKRELANSHSRLQNQSSLMKTDHGLNEVENDVVPWRSSKINHTKEEIYLDIFENVNLVLEKQSKRKNTHYRSAMKIIHGHLNGVVQAHSLLNDVPMVELNINNNGNDCGIPSFHDCVRIDDYINDNEGKGLLNTKIKFIPPDNKFKLMEYNIDMSNNQSNNLGLLSINMENGLGNNNDEFEITINISGSTKVNKIKNLEVNLQFFEDIKYLKKLQNEDILGAEDINSDNIEDDDYKIKILRNTHGRFSNDVDKNKGSWIFDNFISTGTLAILRGCIEFPRSARPSTDDHSNSNLPQKKPINRIALERMNVKYEHEGQLLSGMKVNSIDILNGNTNTKNIFKGVKYIAKMKNCEIRES